MNRDQLRKIQAPLKESYRKDPRSALVTLNASSSLDSNAISCSVGAGQAMVKAGLHPASGGDGTLACSGDMLLQALVACAGVTMRAVATSLGIDIKEGIVRASGDLDFRGTLGVDTSAPVGFSKIQLSFDVQSTAPEEMITKLLELTLRYCVVYQTLASPAQLHADISIRSND